MKRICKNCEFYVIGELNGKPDYYCRFVLSDRDGVKPNTKACGFFQARKEAGPM